MDKLHYNLRHQARKSPVTLQATGCSGCVLLTLALIGLVSILNFIVELF